MDRKGEILSGAAARTGVLKEKWGKKCRYVKKGGGNNKNARKVDH